MIVSLYDYTRTMLIPWAKAGYQCVAVDIAHDGDYVDEHGIQVVKADVRLLSCPGSGIQGVFAFPPCTHLASSGARWWKDKGEEALLEALSTVDAVFRFITLAKPRWWMIENPVGRLSTYLGKPSFTFHPYEYGGYSTSDVKDAYTKRTCLWTGGCWKNPVKNPVTPWLGSSHLSGTMRAATDLPYSAGLMRIRSVTPSGFANAVFETMSPLTEKVMV